MEKIEANRNFVNKLWNSCKFVTGNALKDADEAEMKELGVTGPMTSEEFDKLLLPEKYIVSNAHALVASVTEDIEKYQGMGSNWFRTGIPGSDHWTQPRNPLTESNSG